VDEYEQEIEQWKTLVHVCRRWRSVVFQFQSPHLLNLRLLCTPITHVRDIPDVWPPLPLVIRDSYLCDSSGVNNIIDSLEHKDRVCEIKLDRLTSPLFECVTNSAAMQKPFPELIHLNMYVLDLDFKRSILPDSFLGRTAPRLRSLVLNGIPFPGLPKLLLSATHLVKLDLYGIIHSGYISPKVVATSLSALTSLEYLRLHFLYARPPPALESRHLPPRPLTHSILPSLTKIIFKGSREYLDKILARIDAPRLTDLHISFFNQDIFDTPQLFQFISRRSTLGVPEKGYIAFSFRTILVKFPSQTPDYGLLCEEMGGNEVQTCSRDESRHSDAVHAISGLEDFYTFDDVGYVVPRQDNVENLLRPFVSVKNLYLSKGFVYYIAPTLRALVGGRTTNVFPTLENIFLEGFQPLGPLHESIAKFVAARRLTNHPVAVSRWERDTKNEDVFWDFCSL